MSDLVDKEYESQREKRLRALFREYDVDKSGDLDIKELSKMMIALGNPKSEKDLKEILEAASQQRGRWKKNESFWSFSMPGVFRRKDALTFEQFKELFSIEKLKVIFDEIDTDGSGTISKKEIRIAFSKMGKSVSRSQCDRMLRMMNLSREGEINFNEFVMFFETFPLASVEDIAFRWTNDVVVADVGNGLTPTVPVTGMTLQQTIFLDCWGGVISRCVTAPLEKVNIITQTGNAETTSILKELRYLFETQGIRGLYAGNLMNCIGVLPATLISCFVYVNMLFMLPTDRNTSDTYDHFVHSLCGGVAGLVSTTLTYPIDMVRTRLTVADTQQASARSTVMEVLNQKEGIRGLYRGLPLSLLAVVPWLAIQKGTIDVIRDQLMDSGVAFSYPVIMGMCVTAGMTAQAAVHPLEVLRHRMQLMEENLPPFEKAVRVVRRHGVRVLYRGLGAACVKIVPAIVVGCAVTIPIARQFREQNTQRNLPRFY